MIEQPIDFLAKKYGMMAVRATDWVKSGTVIHEGGVLYVSYDDVYKICFLNNEVNEQSIEAACGFALDRVKNHIEYLCKKALSN